MPRDVIDWAVAGLLATAAGATTYAAIGPWWAFAAALAAPMLYLALNLLAAFLITVVPLAVLPCPSPPRKDPRVARAPLAGAPYWERRHLDPGPTT